jgi:hypothetical protein
MSLFAVLSRKRPKESADFESGLKNLSMSFLAVLILHCTSPENPPTFVTLGNNHSISLSPAAKQSLSNSPVLILAIGSSPDKISFFNDLLLGPTNDPSPRGFFQLRNGQIPDTPEFPFHPGMKLGTFCGNWGFDCPRAQSNRTIIFIASPSDADERQYVAGMSVAVSSIATFSLYVTARWGSSLPNWNTALGETCTALLAATKDVNGSFVVVVPQSDIPGANRDSRASDVNDARKAQDADYTASLRKTWGSGDKSAAFALPDAGRWGTSYWDSMKDIARFVADLAGKADLLPRADAVAVFENAARWCRMRIGSLSAVLSRCCVFSSIVSAS